MHTVDRLYTLFQPEHYNLTLNLLRKERQFTGSVTIAGTITDSAQTIRLHGKELTILSAKVGGETAAFTTNPDLDEIIITPNGELPAGTQTVEISFSGVITDAMHGLYPCYFEHDGSKKELLATQFESHHAREVFPCIDEPEAKATFDLTLQTETGITVLGNMPVAQQNEDETGLQTVFETSPRMSTYLLAFVIGELHSVQAKTSNGTDVRIWATPAHDSESLQFALQTAVGAIDFFNDYFGVPYPLPKCDHVALPDFSSGAMENWGLITYREVALLVDETTSLSMKEYIATVISHELSHQWFGNLVTMKWWNDLWLNESFATLMEYLAVDALHPEWDIWLTFTSGEALSALRRDALPGVQAVKTDVNHPDEISTLFDPSIVYAKGARLLYMLFNFIGEDAFRAGLCEYFKEHKYENTAGSDLWKALSGASGKDIQSFMTPWLEQSGFPLLRVAQNGSSISVSQEHFSLVPEKKTDQLWPVLLAPSYQHDEALILTEGSITLSSPTDETVRFNTGGSAHYTVRYESEAQRLAVASSVLEGTIEPVDRLLLLNDGSMQARAGIGSMSEVLQLLQAYSKETNEPVWDMMSLIIADARRLIEGDDVAEADCKRFVRGLIDSELRRLGWEIKENESSSDTKLRATIIGLAIYTEDQEALQKARDLYEEGIDTLPSELRAVILSSIIRHGSKDEFDELLALHDKTYNPELQQDLVLALTSTRDTSLAAILLERLTDKGIVRHQDVARWFVSLLRNRYSREQAWQWMVEQWSWIEKTFGSDKSYDNYPRYASAIFNTDEWLAKYRAFFEPLSSEPALERTIAIGLDDIASRSKWRTRDASSVKQFLADAVT
ncbi:aminopeptidase [Candidatus Saccharibacteria bacterium]|nr:MAG: aminopeptidase [Candidatus Saccharibacteria bacterium]